MLVLLVCTLYNFVFYLVVLLWKTRLLFKYNIGLPEMRDRWRLDMFVYGNIYIIFGFRIRLVHKMDDNYIVLADLVKVVKQGANH